MLRYAACGAARGRAGAGHASPSPGALGGPEGRPDGRHAREGGEGVSREDRGEGQPAVQPRLDGDVKVYRAHRRGDRVGDRARSQGEGLGLQRAGARPADPGARRRPGPHRARQQAVGVNRRSLPRPDGAERPGRRAVHHPASDQARREVHLRVHRAQRRLAHVPLAPQRGDTRWPKGLLGAFIVEPKRPPSRPRPIVEYTMVLNDGAHRVHAERQGLPGHRAVVCQAGRDGSHPLHERRHDDPPDAPARDAA